MKKIILILSIIFSSVCFHSITAEEITQIDYTYHIQNINNILKWRSNHRMDNIKTYHKMFKDDIFNTKYTVLDEYTFSDYQSLYMQYEELMINQLSLNGKLADYINANDLLNSISTLKKIKRNMILFNLLNESITHNIKITKLSIEKDNFHFNVCVGLEI